MSGLQSTNRQRQTDFFQFILNIATELLSKTNASKKSYFNSISICQRRKYCIL